VANEIERARQLLSDSYSLGFLSDDSADFLEKLLPQTAAQVARALGTGSTDIATDILLVTILVDDSDSIGMISHGIRAEERGHDHLLSRLAHRGGTHALVHTSFLNQGTFSPFSPASEALRLSPGKLSLSPAGTPLYRQCVLTLASVIAKARDLEAQGIAVRTVTLVITDGEDTTSREITARHVRFLVRDMLDMASNHIVAGMGIGERSFYRIFAEMGIPRKFIKTAGATDEDIDAMFDAFYEETLALAFESQASFAQLTAGSEAGGS
jgi:hypothetical protein